MDQLLFAPFFGFLVMAKKQLAYADIPVAQLGRGATHWYKLRKTGSTDTGYPSLLPLYVKAPN